MRGDLRIGGFQPVEVLAKQLEQPAARRRHERALGRLAVEHRHDAEEVAGQVGLVLPRAPQPDLAGRHEIHGLARLAFADHLDVGRQVVGVQQRHHLGHRPRIELRQQRNARHQRPGDDEVAAADLLGKAAGDDGHRQGQHAQPAQHRQHRPQLAQRRDGRHIAVADGGQRGHRPVGRLRHRAELVGLRRSLDVVHAGGAQQQRGRQQQAGPHQRAPLVVQHAQQRVHGRRIARQLEESQQAQHPQHAQVEPQQATQIERQDGQQVDDQVAARGQMQPRPPRPHAGEERHLHRRPDAQAVLDGEDRNGEHLEGAEPGRVGRREVGHRLGHERGDVERDQADDEGVEQPARLIIAAADLDDLVDLTPQLAATRRQPHRSRAKARYADPFATVLRSAGCATGSPPSQPAHDAEPRPPVQSAGPAHS